MQKNGVDGPFLLVLSDEDLAKELGMSTLQIRKLRAAMNDIKAKSSTTNAATPNSSTAVSVTVSTAAVEPAAAAPAPASVPAGTAPAYAPQPAPAVQAVHALPSFDPRPAQDALQLLRAADGALAKAVQLLSSAMSSQAMQTGVAAVTPGRRGISPVGGEGGQQAIRLGNLVQLN